MKKEYAWRSCLLFRISDVQELKHRCFPNPMFVWRQILKVVKDTKYRSEIAFPVECYSILGSEEAGPLDAI